MSPLPAHIHFVGIGGIGMSAIAEVLLSRGIRVTGTDLAPGLTARRLEALGARVVAGHGAEHLGEAEWLVVSSAVPADNPEVAAARARGLRVLSRGEMLATLMAEKQGIAVAGSHGKTTVTALLTTCFIDAGLDPTAIVGGRLVALGSNARHGQGPHLVAEADESDGSFLLLRPLVAVVTTIDPEHLDHYGSLERVVDSFLHFADSVPGSGLVVLGTDDPNVAALRRRVRAPVTTYGLGEDADWRAVAVAQQGWTTRFDVLYRGTRVGEVRIPLPGRHNVANALAVLAVAGHLEVPFAAVSRSLARFEGVERRFQRKGEACGVLVIDDYAHHPTEIEVTLEAARNALPGRRLVVVFQPHRFTRTQALLDAFARSFDRADMLVVTEIYSAGERPIPGVSGARLAEAVGGRHPGHVAFVPRVDDVLDQIGPQLKPGDVLMTVGAGDVWKVGERYLAEHGAVVRGSQA